MSRLATGSPRRREIVGRCVCRHRSVVGGARGKTGGKRQRAAKTNRGSLHRDEITVSALSVLPEGSQSGRRQHDERIVEHAMLAEPVAMRPDTRSGLRISAVTYGRRGSERRGSSDWRYRVVRVEEVQTIGRENGSRWVPRRPSSSPGEGAIRAVAPAGRSIFEHEHGRIASARGLVVEVEALVEAHLAPGEQPRRTRRPPMRLRRRRQPFGKGLSEFGPEP